MVQQKQAFTLIELLVVVLIIGILAAVAVPLYQKAVYKSRYVKLKTLTKSILDAQEVYYLANSAYADDFEKLDVSMPGGQVESEQSAPSLYVYEWGECHMDITESYVQASCLNSSIGMGYQYRSYNSGTTSGRIRMCFVESTDLTDMRQSICKSETGADQGRVLSAYNTTSWNYIN
ncbi:MAG: prepilin-type N-terminal cleavage/methylation domain-containing protein [Elusimicrobiaceae bacterium]|nr:prepilin-type N-terminal cleavage/methylation domain-containing protein [Elusimicrobiaceae bacterium]